MHDGGSSCMLDGGPLLCACLPPLPLRPSGAARVARPANLALHLPRPWPQGAGQATTAHAAVAAVSEPGPAALRQPHTDGNAAAPAAGVAPAPAARSARMAIRADIATGVWEVLWELFLFTHTTQPLAWWEVAQRAAQFSVISAALLTGLLAPHVWLRIRWVVYQGPGGQLRDSREGTEGRWDWEADRQQELGIAGAFALPCSVTMYPFCNRTCCAGWEGSRWSASPTCCWVAQKR